MKRGSELNGCMAISSGINIHYIWVIPLKIHSKIFFCVFWSKILDTYFFVSIRKILEWKWISIFCVYEQKYFILKITSQPIFYDFFRSFIILHSCIFYSIKIHKKFSIWIFIGQLTWQLYAVVVRSEQFVNGLYQYFR